MSFICKVHYVFDRGECVSLENQVTAIERGFNINYFKNGEHPGWKRGLKISFLILWPKNITICSIKRPKLPLFMPALNVAS